MYSIKNKKQIAVLLAVYNGEKFLSEQMESVICQNNTDWTLYVRDDASSDKTLEIIDSYCKKYDNVILVKDNKGNLGCRDNFFELLTVVDSKYYMFCDADDVWHEDKIEVSYQRMKEIESRPVNGSILVVTDYSICDGNLNMIHESGLKALGICEPDKLLSEGCLGVISFLGGSCMMFNDMLKPHLLPVPKNGCQYDTYVGVKAAKYAVIDVIPISTKKYRVHGANVSQIKLEKKTAKIFRIPEIIRDTRKIVNSRKAIGWGGYFKYLYYKVIVSIKLKKMQKTYPGNR